VRRRLDWDQDRRDRELPEHPYRDTALVYLGFAVLIVVVALATGGGLLRAVVIAGLFWICATGYGMLGQRRRRRARERGRLR
jgi:Flp pilus assembly protein TadB